MKYSKAAVFSETHEIVSKCVAGQVLMDSREEIFTKQCYHWMLCPFKALLATPSPHLAAIFQSFIV
jgi:hypothetical protein